MIEVRRSIGPKGQIVLPKDIRDQMNLRPGAEMSFSIEDNQIILKPVGDAKKFVEEFCSLKFKTKPTIKNVMEAIEEQYRHR